MKCHILWRWIPLALGILPISVAAEPCATDSYFGFSVTSPDDLIEKFADCTTITGDIVVEDSYHGPFILPNVVNITGTVYIREKNFMRTRPRPWFPEVTLFEAPDLVHLGGLDIYKIYPLTNISLPRLRKVTRLSIENTDPALDFPSLTDVGALSLIANLSVAKFDSLRTVENSLTIDQCLFCAATLHPPDGLDISFPSLESAGFIRMAGLFSNITMPQLTSAGPPQNPRGDSGIRLHMDEILKPFELNFPKLTSVDKQLYLHGYVKSLSVPSLQSTTASIHIDAAQSLDVNLPLVNASVIELRGDIESVYLTKLARFSRIEIDSRDNLNCSYILQRLNETSGYPEDNSTVSCSSTPDSGGSGGSDDDSLTPKILTGMLVPAAIVCLIIFLVFRRRCFARATKARETVAMERPAQSLCETTTAEERDSSNGLRRASQSVPRENTPPPPYSRHPLNDV